jgi:RHS repeat-associated protein
LTGTQRKREFRAAEQPKRSWSRSVPETRAYTYDADGNRTSVTEAGVSFYYFYDATDALVTKNTTDIAPNPLTPCATLGFCYDDWGDLTTSSPGAPDSNILVPTTYTYDAGGHLLTIADGNPAHTVVFTLDALSRNASQAVGGGSATTYAYLGTSDTVSSMSQGPTVTTTSLIDAIGDRIGQGTSAGLAAYLVADLHGNIVAALSAGSTPTLLSAYRYDAYGETCGAWSADTGSIAVPWRFQGRLLESATGATDLYDFAARSYDPSLGAFTSFDSTTGSAQNPLTLNRYLYANANPATLVDPDGHAASKCVAWGYVGSGLECTAYSAAQASALRKQMIRNKAQAQLHDEQGYYQQEGTYYQTWADLLTGTTDMTTAVSNYRSWSTNTDSTTSIYNWMAMQDSPSISPTPGRPDCHGNWACDLNNAVGTAGDVTQPYMNLAVPIAAVGLCVAAVASVIASPIGCAPAAGMAVYTAANGVNNMNGSTDFSHFMDGWNWQDASFAGLVTTVAVATDAFPVVPLAVVGALAGLGSDLVDQVRQGKGVDVGHLACSAASGAATSVFTFSGSKLERFVKAQVWNFASTLGTTQVCKGF